MVFGYVATGSGCYSPSTWPFPPPAFVFQYELCGVQDEEAVVPPKKKRSKVIQDDDEDEEWMEEKENDDDDDDDDEEEYAESDESDSPVTPRNKKKRVGAAGGSGGKRLKKASDLASYAITETKTPASSARPATGKTGDGGSPVSTPATPRARSILGLSSPVTSSPPKAATATPLPEGVLDTGRHKHHSFDWLNENRVDGNRRKPDHPQYNPRTLYVPPSFLKSETPAMVQWWEFKSKNMDTVLFFKVRFGPYRAFPT